MTDTSPPFRLRRNLVANSLAQVVVAATGLVMLPLYLRTLGLESFGLIALMTSLSGALEFLTRGLGWSLRQRLGQLDRRTAGGAAQIRVLARSFELGYAVVGAVLVLTIGTVALLFADTLSHGGVARVFLVCLAVRAVAMLPLSVYQAVYLGVDEQVRGNTLVCTRVLSVAAAGGLAALTTQDVRLVFVAEVAALVANAVLQRHFVYGLVGRRTAGEPTVMARRELAELAPFAGALVWANGIGVLLKQFDRLYIGGTLSLAQLGVYSVAAAPAQLLSFVYSPYLVAVFPRACALAARDPVELSRHACASQRAVGLVSVGVGVPLGCFSPELLRLWAGSESVTAEAVLVAGVLVAAAIALASADALAQVNVARGRGRPSALVNTGALVFYPAVLVPSVLVWGIVGAALAWLAYCVSAWLILLVYAAATLPPGYLHQYARTAVAPMTLLSSIDWAIWLSVRELVDGDWASLLLGAAASAVVLVAALAISLRAGLGARAWSG